MATAQQTGDNRPVMYILALICFDRLKIVESAALISGDKNQSYLINTEETKLKLGAKYEEACTTDAQCMVKDPNSVCKSDLSTNAKSCVCAPDYLHAVDVCRHHGSANTIALGLSPSAERTAIIGGCVAGVVACCGIAVLVYIRWRSARRQDKREWIRTQVGQKSVG